MHLFVYLGLYNDKGWRDDQTVNYPGTQSFISTVDFKTLETFVASCILVGVPFYQE